MIAHIVTMKFKHAADEATVLAFHNALSDMRERLGPVIESYVHGPGLALRDGAVDYGIVSIVRDETNLHRYLDDEGHQALTAKFAPLLFENRQAVQVAVDSD
ncbi:Dabb family protein [Glaciihabitans sp. UYNi722]|uniref:Dabb family protein n=1 Tax=Glaciihabitans sp. UYNi722 TaxID=3156344 RepID=UPI00339336DB